MRSLLLAAALLVGSPALAEDVLVPVDGVTTGLDAEALIWDAAARMKRGDLDGADILLDEAERADLPDNLATEVVYQRANVRALDRDYAAARDLFQEIVDDHGGSHRELDARFRVAELTGVLGDPEGALDGLKALGNPKHMEAADRAKIAFNQAIFTLESGRSGKGRRLLKKALKRNESGLVGYYEAKAWVALSDEALDRIDAMALRGGRKKLTKTLIKRREGMMQAERALAQTIQLQEPEWVLAGLLRMSESYEDLGNDLLAAEEPDLTPAQLDIYRDELHQQVEQIWLKSLTYLDGGVEVAERLNWDSARVEELQSRRDALMQRIEAGFQAG